MNRWVRVAVALGGLLVISTVGRDVQAQEVQYPASICWDWPTTLADGSPLTDLAFVRLIYRPLEGQVNATEMEFPHTTNGIVPDGEARGCVYWDTVGNAVSIKDRLDTAEASCPGDCNFDGTWEVLFFSIREGGVTSATENAPVATFIYERADLRLPNPPGNVLIEQVSS